MNFLILLILFIPCISHAQSAEFKEIIKKPNINSCSDSKYYQIISPIITTGNIKIDSVINEQIRILWEGDPDTNIANKHLPVEYLIDSAISNQGLSYSTYKINYNSRGYLSISLFQEFCYGEGDCSDWPSGYTCNFDLLTGKALSLNDIIQKEKIGELIAKATKDKTTAIKHYKKKLYRQLKRHEITGADFEKITTLINQTCDLFSHVYGEEKITDFILYPQSIDLINFASNCQFSPFLPNHFLKYKTLKNILTDDFAKRVLNK